MKYLNIIIISSIIFTGCLSGGSGGISFGGRNSGGSSSSNSSASATASDTTAPTVTNVNSNTAAATYGVGAIIDVRITFSEAVTVTGTPVITLETGTTDRNASYASGSGTTELVFNYTVQGGDSSSDLDFTATTSLALSGGTIKDAAGNNATLTLVAPAAAGSLGANEAIVVDGLSKVIQVAAGGKHSCALLSDGTVKCWGSGNQGKLGYGNTTFIGDDEVPRTVGTVNVGGSVIQLSLGSSHTCALLATGAVRCWGAASSGQLGYNNTNDIGDDEVPSTAGDVSIGGAVVQISAGGNHNCALLATGAVRCWGLGNLGQLGYSSTNNIGDDELPSTAGDVNIGASVVQVDAGAAHTCAVLSTGAVKCWGEGGNGKLGYSNTNNIGDDEFPSMVGNVNVGGLVKQVVTASGHTCALLSAGTVRCWGANGSGQLGYNNAITIGDDEVPSIAGDVNIGGLVKQISSGFGEHTCVILATGSVRCWGDGSFSQLGYNNTNDVGDDEFPSAAGDVTVGGEVIQISSGEFHTCALLANGTVRCWGDSGQDEDGVGALGYGNTNTIGDNETPASAGDVDIGGSQAVKQLAFPIGGGAEHTCAILVTGVVRCWGNNTFGQLGYVNTNSIGDDETPLSAGNVNIGGTAIQVSAGETHTCALLSDGNVRCWGRGLQGRLGYGNTNNIGDDETPASAGNVNVGGTVIYVVAGQTSTCAIIATGAVRCWGSNGSGVLGYGNTTAIGDDELPSTVGDVSLGGTAIQIAIGGNDHACALLSSGDVRCWGDGDAGKTGQGNTTVIGDDELPSSVAVVNIGGVAVQIVTGFEHSCVLLATGAVRCWGRNDSGQLGYGNTTYIGDDEAPATAGDVSVGGLVKQISAGDLFTCALLVDGNVKCWGENASGMLGYGNMNNIGDDEFPSTVGNISLGGSVVQISTGTEFSCALLVNGNVRCWGDSNEGKLGYGNADDIGDDEAPSSVGTVSVF